MRKDTGMIDHIWSVLCFNSITDKDTNLISLINVLEQLNIQGEPKLDGKLGLGIEIVSLWSRSINDVPCERSSQLSVYSPSGDLIYQKEHRVDLTEFERMRVRGYIQGLNIPEAGRYNFIVEIQDENEEGWLEVAKIPMTVVFTPEDETSE